MCSHVGRTPGDARRVEQHLHTISAAFKVLYRQNNDPQPQKIKKIVRLSHLYLGFIPTCFLVSEAASGGGNSPAL